MNLFLSGLFTAWGFDYLIEQKWTKALIYFGIAAINLVAAVWR